MNKTWRCEKCGTLYASYIKECIICDDLRGKADARHKTFDDVLNLYKNTKTRIIISK